MMMCSIRYSLLIILWLALGFGHLSLADPFLPKIVKISKNGGITIRQKPSERGQIVGLAQSGDRYRVIKGIPRYLNIRFDGDKTGWIHIDFYQKSAKLQPNNAVSIESIQGVPIRKNPFKTRSPLLATAGTGSHYSILNIRYAYLKIRLASGREGWIYTGSDEGTWVTYEGLPNKPARHKDDAKLGTFHDKGRQLLHNDGLVLWLDAGQAASLLTQAGPGGLAQVATWKDLSGRGHDAIQNSKGRQPSITTNSLNNSPALYFDGEDQLIIPKLSYGTFTIFSVWRAPKNAVIYELKNSKKRKHRVALNTFRYRNIILEKKDKQSAKSAESGWRQKNALRLTTHRYAGSHSSHKLYENTKSVSTDGDYGEDPGLIPWQGTFSIGSDYQFKTPMQGILHELIVFDRAVDERERQDIEAYLVEKWQL